MLTGCPKSHGVHNQTSDSDQNILTDNCTEGYDDEWLAEEEAVDNDAEIIVDMGCLKKIRGLQMKNINKKQGGTKQFTIFLSEFPDGPWESILSDKFPEETLEGCGSMQTHSIR